MKRWWWALAALGGLVVLAGVFVVGRVSAPRHDRAWEDAYGKGYDYGVSIGRALQLGDTVGPAGKAVATKSFQAGYRAAQLDTFGNYDGGWAIGQPYIVILGSGTAGAPYRVAYRDPMAKGVSYTTCPTPLGVCTR